MVATDGFDFVCLLFIWELVDSQPNKFESGHLLYLCHLGELGYNIGIMGTSYLLYTMKATKVRILWHVFIYKF